MPVIQALAFEYLEDQKAIYTKSTQLRKDLHNWTTARDGLRIIGPQVEQQPILDAMSVDLSGLLLEGKLETGYVEDASAFAGIGHDDQVCTATYHVYDVTLRDISAEVPLCREHSAVELVGLHHVPHNWSFPAGRHGASAE